ncbi:alpha-glucosidase [Flavobacterium akiainvivens]|uniref:Alpha-glucosidase n=1 Tax=Flavobacterium akiainvivens TaxID=1202724 RepID=A0A0M9VHY6_9FLAO|nr:glycoside hydrolase family 97 protein [Flavobacterium akiainvivens]KOS06086.1 alpha-glucosidase [Flavobacterium akiainvivens]SFQ54832.1 Glycosyl-hydrolase 97 C-terminal, oligomerisation [Flavobacterium akiainvivens]
MYKMYCGGALLALLMASCSTGSKTNDSLNSPDNNLTVDFGVNAKQQAWYLVKRNSQVVIDTSSLGLVRKDADFSKALKVADISESEKVEDTYTMLTGKAKDITYSANQKTLHLENAGGQKMDIVFNVSNDGVAFKYKFPETSGDVKYITDEKTAYNFKSSTKAWLQPMSKAKSGWEGCNPAYEEYYQMDVPVNATSPIGEGWIYPALFKDGDTWVSVSETELGSNYCATHLKYDEAEKAMKVVFPQPEEVFAKGAALNPESKLPWETPWRILAIGDLQTVAQSTLGTDLADKAVTTDVAFVQPGISSWSWAILKDDSVNYDTTKQFIDYAHQMKWPYCLIDAGWDWRIGIDKIKELVAYAKERNVKLILWYNSAGDWNTVKYTPKDRFLTEESREKEFKWLHDMGIAGVKIDFFGGDGQSMIAYYHDILKSALKHKILVNFHGATLPRGWQRTYPNLMTAEAIKGFEFISFEQNVADAAPQHCAMLPFGRNLYDPMDFTPMSLDVIPNINRRSTAAFELALPTLFLSGVQHLAEIPEGMAKQPDYVVNYLKDIPAAWDETKLLAGYPGKDVVMARRKGTTWYITGINGENKAKTLDIDLSFIKKDGFIITDGATDKWESKTVKPGKTTASFKPYGGFVMKF